MIYIDKPNYPKTTLREQSGHSLTLRDLKDRLDKLIANGVDLDTPIAIEHCENQLFLDYSWKLIDYLWESGWNKEADGTPAIEYRTCVTVSNAFMSEDLNKDKLFIITPHY